MFSLVGHIKQVAILRTINIVRSATKGLLMRKLWLLILCCALHQQHLDYVTEPESR